MGFFSSVLGMGPPKSDAVKAAERSLSPDELKAIHAEFKAVAGSASAVDATAAARLLGLGEAHNQPFALFLLPSLRVDRPSEGFTAGDFTIARVGVKGGESGWREYLFTLLSTTHSLEGAIPRSGLVRAVEGSLRFVLKGEGVDGELVERVVVGALGEKDGMELKAWKTWSKQREVVEQPALDLRGVDAAFLASPRCHMSPSLAALLSCGMPAGQRKSWELLFHSDKNGKSFNTFMACVCGRGATLMLVTDKAGNTFGGFAGQPWAKAGTFTGDFSCFVFSVRPATAIYRPSGVNENFQWCGQGFNSLPNGVGFGGQSGYYAVFVDDTLDKGMTRQAATYNNPAFAEEQLFEVDTVECWLVEPSEEELEQREKQGTAMDRFRETNKFLSITGVQQDHSAAYRDDRPFDVEDNSSKFR